MIAQARSSGTIPRHDQVAQHVTTPRQYWFFPGAQADVVSLVGEVDDAHPGGGG
jgi:hypothetical protein